MLNGAVLLSGVCFCGAGGREGRKADSGSCSAAALVAAMRRKQVRRDFVPI